MMSILLSDFQGRAVIKKLVHKLVSVLLFVYLLMIVSLEKGLPTMGLVLPLSDQCQHALKPPREQINQITHYIDGSMVYGSTDTRADFLREFEGGRLRVGEDNHLPRQQVCT